MTHRFISLPMCFTEEDEVFTVELKVLPLSIEAYLPVDISYATEEGDMVERPGTRIITKSGVEYDILLSIEEFEEATKHA